MLKHYIWHIEHIKLIMMSWQITPAILFQVWVIFAFFFFMHGQNEIMFSKKAFIKFFNKFYLKMLFMLASFFKIYLLLSIFFSKVTVCLRSNKIPEKCFHNLRWLH